MTSSHSSGQASRQRRSNLDEECDVWLHNSTSDGVLLGSVEQYPLPHTHTTTTTTTTYLTLSFARTRQSSTVCCQNRMVFFILQTNAKTIAKTICPATCLPSFLRLLLRLFLLLFFFFFSSFSPLFLPTPPFFDRFPVHVLIKTRPQTLKAFRRLALMILLLRPLGNLCIGEGTRGRLLPCLRTGGCRTLCIPT